MSRLSCDILTHQIRQSLLRKILVICIAPYLHAKSFLFSLFILWSLSKFLLNFCQCFICFICFIDVEVVYIYFIFLYDVFQCSFYTDNSRSNVLQYLFYTDQSLSNQHLVLYVCTATGYMFVLQLAICLYCNKLYDSFFFISEFCIKHRVLNVFCFLVKHNSFYFFQVVRSFFIVCGLFSPFLKLKVGLNFWL